MKPHQHKSYINFFEIEDGEKIFIEQYIDDELTDQIVMDRNVALDLAKKLLNLLKPI